MGREDGIDRPQRREWVRLSVQERMRILGHRDFVGGNTAEMWYGIGRRQFHFLVSQGLAPHHRFLDIGCGSLRLGQFLTPYLERGRYFGLEAEPDLVEAGLAEELLFDIAQTRAPVFGHGYEFDFGFVPGFDVAVAQSLFTHLTDRDIQLCLRNLRTVATAQSVLYFTFFEGNSRNTRRKSHAHRSWKYTRDDMEVLAKEAGWATEYIGGWGHERGQTMMRARVMPGGAAS